MLNTISKKIKIGISVVVLSLVVNSPQQANALSINFQQIDWGDGTGGFNALNSDWGRVEVHLQDGDEASLQSDGSGGYFGYINIATGVAGTGMTDNWAVQNIPVVFSDEADLHDLLPEGFSFDLGVATGTDVSAIDFQLSLDAAPVTSIANFGNIVTSDTGGTGTSVTDTTHIYGGLDGVSGMGVSFSGGTDRNAPPAAQNTVGAMVGETMNETAKISGKETDVKAIDEELNGCAPGSAARSIHYMAQFNSDLAMALGTDTPQDTYEGLRDDMMTDVGDEGDGTLVDKFKSGKDTYSSDNNLNIKTEQTTDFMEAMKVLSEKGDVELMVYWGKDEMGDSLGGHAAFVSEIIKIKDAMGMIQSYKVTIIDDRTQGDNMASNSKTTLIFNADGTLRGYGNMAQIIGFQTETIIPEPKTYLLFGGFLLIASLIKKRQKRKKWDSKV